MTSSFWNGNVREHLRVTSRVRLRDIDPAATPATTVTSDAGKAELVFSAQELRELQEKLFAQSRAGGKDRLLVILQAMDAAGKGGIVNRVFGTVEPHGLRVTAFKTPTEEERARDFLWRIEPHVPEPGVIALFDRSHYEDVLIHRVHELAPPEELERRYEAINDFERRHAESGVRILKFMLHISPEEQARRLLARLDNPAKHWKYHRSDVDERMHWADYMEAFEIAINRTNSTVAPWFVVPADAKWYARAAVQRIVITELQRMNLDWPEATFNVEAERARMERTLDLTWP